METVMYDAVRSLPMWERGLKLLGLLPVVAADASLPMWERGLKPVWVDDNNIAYSRSPCGSVD